MTQTDFVHAAELERQDLIKQAHCLIAVIASRPGSIKLLRGILPVLQQYAQYKSRQRRKRVSR
jgi:hypothetical protein